MKMGSILVHCLDSSQALFLFSCARLQIQFFRAESGCRYASGLIILVNLITIGIEAEMSLQAGRTLKYVPVVSCYSIYDYMCIQFSMFPVVSS